MLSARGAKHMACIVFGKVIEVHWTEQNTSKRVIDATDLADWAWDSGAIVAPAEDVNKAWSP